MLMRSTLRAAVLTALAVATVQACPNTEASRSRSAMSPAPPPSHASIVAWKPRPWAPAVPANGFVVSIDPVDGTLGMPAAGAFGPLAPVGDEAPVATFRRANGSVRATLDDRFAEFAVVRIGADGKPAWTCVHGTTGAAGFMKHPVAKSSPAPASSPVWEK
jgi:hypothetical protein